MNHHLIQVFKPIFTIFLALGPAAGLLAQTPEFPPLDTLPVLDSLPDELAADACIQLAVQASAIRDVFDRMAGEAVTAQEDQEQATALLKADTLTSAEDRKAAEKKLKQLKSATKTAQNALKKAQKAAEAAEKLAGMSPAEQRKNLPKAYKTVAALLPKPPESEEAPISEVIGPVIVAVPTGEEPSPPATSVDTTATELPPAEEQPAEPAEDQAEGRKTKKEKKSVPAGPVFKVYHPAGDVLLNPPPRPCRLTVDTRDEFSGERRREIEKEELFRFTNPSLKSYFQDRDHIRCEAALSNNNNTFLLNLTFTIQDVNARRAFGSLPRNGVAILKYIDGETITLYNLRADEGQTDGKTPVFTFRGQYTVEPGMLKKMQKALIDKIRVAWATGYEDYDIQNVDLLQRQLGCLLKS